MHKMCIFVAFKLSCGVIGNTSDSGSEESRFEPWQDNFKGILTKKYFASMLKCFSVRIFNIYFG